MENNSVNQRLDLQHSYNLNQLNENNASEVNQKVDNFKLELEKAMESNFNWEYNKQEKISYFSQKGNLG